MIKYKTIRNYVYHFNSPYQKLGYALKKHIQLSYN